MIAELSKRRVFRVISGYAVVCFVILQIADVAFEPLGIGDGVLRIVIATMLLALPLVAYLSWIFDVDPESSLQRSEGGRPWLEASITTAALLGLAIGAWYVLRPSTVELNAQLTHELATSETPLQVEALIQRSVAVLPFTSMGTNEKTGSFADGLTDDILNNLAQTPNIKVASRSASFQFSDRGYDPSLVGDKLGVSYLMEGSVRQSGDEVRITIQLIRTQDGYQAWSRSYERTLSDGFEMQTTLAANVANVAAGKLNLDYASLPQNQDPAMVGVDSEAVKLYFSAVNEYLDIRLGEGGNFDTVVRLLESAVEVDPNFFAPYPFLTTAYYQRHRWGLVSIQDARPAAHAAIKAAMTLNPDEFESQFQLATVHLHLDLNYKRAQAELRHLLMRRPKFGLVHLRLARIELREGRTSAVNNLLANASQLEAAGEKALFLANAAWLLSVAKDYEGALGATTSALKLVQGSHDRAIILREHAASLIQMGRIDEARPYVEEGWRLNGTTSPEDYIALFANIGELDKSKEIAASLGSNVVDYYALATGYLALGDLDTAFEYIRVGINNHDQYLLESFLVADWWAPVRKDLRFAEMVELLDSKVIHTDSYALNLKQQDDR